MVFKGLMFMYHTESSIVVPDVKFAQLLYVARQKTMKTLAFSDSLLGNAKREWLSAKCVIKLIFIMALKVTISNNRDNREYTSELFKDGVFPLGAYKYFVNMVSDFYSTGAVITIRVNPDVLDGNIF